MGDFEFEPAIHQRELPAEVAAARLENAAAEAGLTELLQPRLEGNLAACQHAVDVLIEHHRHIAERSDIDLEAQTRWVALWELSGRCLSVANLLLDELRLGYTSETPGTMRILHEAANLLAVATHEEDAHLTRRWLAGRRVEQRRARAAIGEAQRAIDQALQEQGIEIEGDLEELVRQIYRVLSKGTHNDREGFADAHSSAGRLFVYGPHPSPVVRATWASYASELIEQVVLEVGDALARFYGGDWYRETVRPLVEGLRAVRADQPLDHP
jgi:hypothetical protein